MLLELPCSCNVTGDDKTHIMVLKYSLRTVYEKVWGRRQPDFWLSDLKNVQMLQKGMHTVVVQQSIYADTKNPKIYIAVF